MCVHVRWIDEDGDIMHDDDKMSFTHPLLDWRVDFADDHAKWMITKASHLSLGN